MDYEKEYKEARERAREFLKDWEECGAVGEALEKARNIFPELKESEDERIRKQLIAVVELYYGETDEQEKKDCLSWLEKKSEQKSVEDIAKEVIKDKESAVKFLKSADIMDSNGELAKEYRDEQNLVEWSEKDAKMLNDIIYSYQHGWSPHNGQIDWLKALPEKLSNVGSNVERNVGSWKPSEELIMYLSEAIDVVEKAEKYSIVTALKEILKQLKALL